MVAKTVSCFRQGIVEKINYYKHSFTSFTSFVTGIVSEHLTILCVFVCVSVFVWYNTKVATLP